MAASMWPSPSVWAIPEGDFSKRRQSKKEENIQGISKSTDLKDLMSTDFSPSIPAYENLKI
jgi:DNA replicative helicase MCM subunit Mcm2 (Cdc46/Mcm family)